MKKSRLLGTVHACLISFISMSSPAALIPKLGGQVVYDTDRDITWIADTNLAASNTFGLPVREDLGPHPSDGCGCTNSRIGSDGSMDPWEGTQHWIDAMNAANYLGFNDWRLPTAQIPDPVYGCGHTSSSNYNCTLSEMGHLFYDEFRATAGTALLDTGDPMELAKFNFTNFPRDYYQEYWSGIEAIEDPSERVY